MTTASRSRRLLLRAAAFPMRRPPACARRALPALALSAALSAGLGAQTAHAQGVSFTQPPESTYSFPAGESFNRFLYSLSASVSGAFPQFSPGLPPGITWGGAALNRRITLSGTPTTPGTYPITLTIRNTSLTAQFTITITGPPTVIPSGTYQVAEDAGPGDNVGAALTTGGFSGSGGAWSITGGNTGGAFSISAAGQIQVAGDLDHETTPSYTLTVQFAQGGETATASVTVAVTDVNEAPEPIGTIGPVTAALDGGPVDRTVSGGFSDPEGDALTYTAASDDTAVATASASGGTVTITPVAVGTATVTVTAMDPSGLTAMQGIDVTVTSLEPVALGFAFAEYNTNENTGSVEICATSSVAVSTNIDVAFELAEDSATEPEDFRIPDSTAIRIASGRSEGCVGIPVVNDGEVELDERFNANLVSVTPTSTSTQAFSLGVAPTTRITILVDDAGLSALALSAGALNPAFDPAVTAYTATVGNATASLTVTPSAIPGASITVNGDTVASGAASGAIDLDVGANTITIVLTVPSAAQPAVNTRTRTYTVAVTREASTDATLSALTLSAGALNPAFDPAVTAYTAAVGNDVASLTVTPTAADSDASIAVDGDSVASGAASGAIPLDVGTNTITILVTAEDGATTRAYTVAVARPAALRELTLSEGTLSPALTAGVDEYDVSVAADTASLTVTPTVISGATVTVNGESVASGSASAAIDLTASAVTTIAIVVTTATGAETYTLRVTRGSGAVPDRVSESVLPHVAQAAVAGTLSAITGRIDAAAGAAPLRASGLAGRANLLQALKANERGLEEGTTDLARALGGSSFVMPLNAADDGGSGLVGDAAVWGSGDWRRLSGPDGGTTDWDGDMLGFHLGADMRMGPELLAGLAVSHSSGSFDYTDRGGPQPVEGKYDSRMTGVHPYVSWSPAGGPRLWATAGYGWGDIEIREENLPARTSDTEMWSAGAGGSHVLVSDDGALPGGAATLRLKGEGALASIDVEGGEQIRPVEFDVRHVRAALEGSWECPPGAAGGCLSPSVEVGVRHDGGDARTGAGVEVGGTLRYADRSTGLTLELRGRSLVADGDGHEDWGVGGLIRLDPAAGGRGLSLRVAPGFGGATGEGRLYREGAFGAAEDGTAPSGRLDAEIGYGFIAGGGRMGVLTPYAALSLAEESSRSWRMGGRLEVGPSLSVNLEGQRRESATEDPDHEILLRGRIGW